MRNVNVTPSALERASSV